MIKSDEQFVEQFVNDHEELFEALGNEEKHDLYQNKWTKFSILISNCNPIVFPS